jgi:hypothetical protein
VHIAADPLNVDAFGLGGSPSKKERKKGRKKGRKKKWSSYPTVRSLRCPDALLFPSAGVSVASVITHLSLVHTTYFVNANLPTRRTNAIPNFLLRFTTGATNPL